MKSDKSGLFQTVRRKDILLFPILFIVSLGLLGWLFDEIVYASASSKFIPIAPSTALIFFIFSGLLILYGNFRRAPIVQSIITPLVLLVVLYCLAVLSDNIFDFWWDIENIFIVNPKEFGGVTIGRMSPITSLLFSFIGICILAAMPGRSKIVRYIGGSFSLLSCFVATVLLIGYLYNAPLLYGSQIIPVALPTAICFLFFSITLLRMFELKYWTFNLIKKNPTKILLLKTFLPLLFFVVILQGYITSNFTVVHNNPALSSALIILIIVVLTIFIVIRASSFLGGKLMKTENLLRESEQFSRSLLQTIPFGLHIVDEKGIIIFQSNNLKRLFSDDAIGKKCWHLYRDDKTQCSDCPLRAGIKVGETEVYESKGVLGGKIFEIIHTGMMFKDRKAMLEIFIDITKRKQVEASLIESENKYRTLIENIGEGIGFVNIDEQFVITNNAAEEIFGVGPGGLVGKRLDQFVSEEQYAVVQKETTHRAHGNVSVYELDIIRPNGQYRTILITAVPQQNKEGVFIGTLGVFRDISERKLAEAEIKLKNEELLKLNAEKDKFFSIISHDLRSPFNGFLGLTRIMDEDLPTMTMGEIREIVVGLRSSATNLFRLLENLLEWAKMQQGLVPFDPKMVELLPIVDECISITQELAKNKGIELACHIPKEISVFADSNILKTIIRNLVSNALKFTTKGGEVNILAKIRADKSVEISISDTGIGMKKEMVQNLFRIDVQTSRKGTEGEPSSGLGLLLCKEFIEEHGGIIWVESEEGKGSVFRFTIPVHVEQMK
jgi:PAS domain S-box-containing protein